MNGETAVLTFILFLIIIFLGIHLSIGICLYKGAKKWNNHPEVWGIVGFCFGLIRVLGYLYAKTNNLKIKKRRNKKCLLDSCYG